MGYSPYDRVNDPSPDVCSVVQNGETFKVRHYPHYQSTRPCCQVTVKIKPEDRQFEHGPEIAALARADRMILEKHSSGKSTR